MIATIFIDGKPYIADEEENVLETCLEHGLDLPYFCWHPALGSIGACRQCAVKQDGRIVMARIRCGRWAANVSRSGAAAGTQEPPAEPA